MKVLVTTFWLVLSFTAVAADEIRFKLLSESRADITFPEFSLDEKRTLVDQSRLVLDQLFVHRLTKRANFGESVDHTPRLNDLAARMGTISTAQFNSELTNIYFKLNDAHTNYRYPTPYSCYRTFLPIDFNEALTSTGQRVIAISNFATKPGVRALWTNPQNLRLGDIVHTIDGVDVYEHIEQLKTISMGANPDAKKQFAISLLSFKSQRLYAVPSNDSVSLSIERADGVNEMVEVPWLTSVKDECLNPPTTPTATTQGTSPISDKQEIFRKPHQRNKNGTLNGWTDTTEPVLKYRIHQNAHGRFAIIRLESFVPEDLSNTQVIELVISLLQGPLSNTDGLIWDLRNNGGGYIDLAHSLIELFTPQDITPLSFRLLNTDANFHYWSKYPANPFTEVLNRVRGSNATYTSTIPWPTAARFNINGQFYFSPVAILTNATCYSSCDMFSALMQDHGIAKIYGEQSTTGAGGANNYFHRSIITDLSDNLGPFIELPAGSNISFSFRQTLRVKTHANELIEDIGVRSDRILAPCLVDLTSDSSDQLLVIGRELKQARPARTSFMSGSDFMNFEVGQEPQWPARWSNVTRLTLQERTQGNLSGIQLPQASGEASLNLPRELTQAITRGQLHIRGFNNNQLVTRKVLKYRVIPASTEISENSSLPIDLSSALGPIAIYNYDSEAINGWRVGSGVLRVGSGASIANKVTTNASVFVKLPEQTAMAVRIDYNLDTDENYDFFSATVIVDGVSHIIILPTSGTATESKLISLAAYKGKKVEIRLNFTSDNVTESNGVTVRRLEFVPSPSAL